MPPAVAGYPSISRANYYFLNLEYTRIFSPTLLNEFHFVAQPQQLHLGCRGKASTFNDSDLGINVTPDITRDRPTFTSIPVFTLVQ